MAPFLIKLETFLSVPACTGARWLLVCGGLQGEAHHCSAWGFPGTVPASGSQEPPSRGGVAGVFPSSLPFPYFEAPIDFPLEIDLTFSPTPLLARFRLAFKKKKSKGDFHRFQKLNCCSQTHVSANSCPLLLYTRTQAGSSKQSSLPAKRWDFSVWAVGLSWAVAVKCLALSVVFRDHLQRVFIKYSGPWDPPEAEMDPLETSVNWGNSGQIRVGKGWKGNPAVGVHQSTER